MNIELPLQPQNNSQLFGHEQLEQTLLHAFKGKHMPSSIILTGPKSIGKATLAYRLARFIFGQPSQSKSLYIAEDQLIFKRIANDNYSDLLVVQNSDSATQNISVDEVRRIKQFLHLSPAESNYRMVIIDAADDMTVAASNALLKVLEEPPQNTILLLISHNINKLLATIRSRCCVYRLHLPPKGEAEEVTRQLCPGIQAHESAQLLNLSTIPGQAIALYQANALEYYQAILEIMNKGNIINLHLVHKLADKSPKERWWVICYLVDYFLCKVIKYAGGIKIEPMIFAGEEEIIQSWSKISLDKLLELYQEILAHMQTITHSNLDHKHGLLLIFNCLRKQN